MNLTLLRKDLRESAWLLVALVLLGAAVLGLITYAASDQGRFAGLTRFTGVWGVAVALVLTQRLFVQEQTSRTAELLDVLPISRATVFTTKALAGALFLALTHTAAWAAVWLVQSRSQLIDSTSAGWAWLATVSAALVFYAWGLLAAALGRYRAMVWLGGFMGASSLTESSAIPVGSLPAIGLLRDTVAASTSPPDPTALISTWALTAACATAAAALSLTAEGRVTAALARRMTAQERTAIVLLGFTLLVATSKLKDRRERPPMTLAGAEVTQLTHAQVATLPAGHLTRETAAALSAEVADDVDRLAEALEVERAPDVFLLPRPGFDPHLVADAKIADHDGVALVFADRGGDGPLLRSRVLAAILDKLTHDDASTEPCHAWTQGVAAWWPARDGGPAHDAWWARAMATDPPAPDDLRHWHTTAERLGPYAASAVAFTFIEAAAAHAGPDAVARITRDAVRQGCGGVRPIEAALAGTGTDLDALTAWIAARRAERPPWDGPAVRGTVRFDGPAGQRVAHVQVDPPDARAWVVYKPLTPWSGGVTAGRLPRVDVIGGSATLPDTFATGSRLFLAFEHADPKVGLVRTDAWRGEVP